MKNYREIVFVDAALKDWEKFLASLDQNIEIVLIDPYANALKQIVEHLSESLYHYPVIPSSRHPVIPSSRHPAITRNPKPTD